jgi:hypothetical protein
VAVGARTVDTGKKQEFYREESLSFASFAAAAIYIE